MNTGAISIAITIVQITIVAYFCILYKKLDNVHSEIKRIDEDIRDLVKAIKEKEDKE